MSKLSADIERYPQLGLFTPAGTVLHSSEALEFNVEHL